MPGLVQNCMSEVLTEGFWKQKKWIWVTSLINKWMIEVGKKLLEKENKHFNFQMNKHTVI